MERNWAVPIYFYVITLIVQIQIPMDKYSSELSLL